MNLNDVHRGIQKHKKRRRIGRGPGSGYGKTASRGHKGQKARHGWSQPAVFEGGKMALVRRVPKRGFFNKFAPSVATVNVSALNEAFESGEEVTLASLEAKKLLKGRFDLLKILGDGDLTKSLKVTAHRFSGSALEKIQQAGGEAITLPGKKPVVKNKQGKKR
ncbi:MAG: 50S ribosomal protein L15 [Rhodopirellula sp.]|nr:50S ribosomal protein L15 [Rhodopirellula sp.]